MPANDAPRLLIEERRREILRLLEQQGRVTVIDLSKRFQVSAVTVRDDLEALSDAGALVRSYGGAIRPLNTVQDFPLNFKKSVHQAEKGRIAAAAAALIQPHQTIILDSGTTSTLLAEQLKQLNPEALTVITHALDVAWVLADSPGIAVIMIGGVLRHISHSFVGPQAQRMLQDLHADHFFLAVDGFDIEMGLFTPDILEAQLNSQMINVSREVTVIADSSKFGRRSVSRIDELRRVHRFITDDRLRGSAAEEMRKAGVEVMLV